MIAQLQQLLLTGLTREVELFARLRPGDPWIVGKLDEVALAMEQPGGGGSGEDADGGRQYAQMVEIKTRSQPNKPRDGQARNACLQVRVQGGRAARGWGGQLWAFSHSVPSPPSSTSQVLLYHRIYEAFRSSSLADLREFLLGGGRGRGWQRGGGGGGGGSGGQQRNGGGGGRQHGPRGGGGAWQQPSAPELYEGLDGAGVSAGPPSSPVLVPASGLAAVPGSGAEAGTSPFGAAASGLAAVPGSTDAGPSPSVGVSPTGKAAGSKGGPAYIVSGRSTGVENGGGLNGGARLGEALQQQCFSVLPDHSLSDGQRFQGERGIMAAAQASGSARGGGTGSIVGSASLGSHMGSGGSVHDPIDLLQDDIPLSPPILSVLPVPLPEASPSPAHWTLSALIEHLHGAVLPSLPPAAPGSPDGPAHLVRYYYRGIASAPAALDAAAAAAAGEGGGGAGSSGLTDNGGAVGGFLKPDTEVQYEE